MRSLEDIELNLKDHTTKVRSIIRNVILYNLCGVVNICRVLCNITYII